MNLPNKMSLSRIFLSFLFLFFMGFSAPWMIFCGTCVFFVCIATDFFDGYWARKKGLVTAFGSFIDPLADKILLTVSLLVFLQRGFVSIWVVVLILVREFFVMGLRFMVLFQKKILLPALFWGKVKTVSQFITLFFILLLENARVFDIVGDRRILYFLKDFLIILTVFMTIFSGCHYFWMHRDCFEER